MKTYYRFSNSYQNITNFYQNRLDYPYYHTLNCLIFIFDDRVI